MGDVRNGNGDGNLGGNQDEESDDPDGYGHGVRASAAELLGTAVSSGR
ncbi:MAG TPA: hypothetical protein PKA30_10935 [Accumulibacter sp.]|nr:hypothetical protein [Accumulibacter sp.]HMV06051.1 hypothetical protein [Accumulibacter sp.]HND40089.1 hypothetical protein [Accumulibacter sp.]HNE40936.1 hypothetical protein [Accumulibacter sp.]HNG87102.1 hypothetical protein [Accumulibacter sp.]